jgi:class 3 adenylate cyclase
MMAAVHRYGGYVAQSTGDGIFALFGAPVAHEDHPQRALHAALAMQGELHRYAYRLRAGGKIPVEVRVGVNMGEVVVRSIQVGGHTEYTPVGHVTNLAARMQTAAPAGSIAATEVTQRLCEGYLAIDIEHGQITVTSAFNPHVGFGPVLPPCYDLGLVCQSLSCGCLPALEHCNFPHEHLRSRSILCRGNTAMPRRA